MLMKNHIMPRDDLESLLYLMLYLLWGKLPWNQNLPVMSEDYDDHVELQRVIHQLRDPQNLCSGQLSKSSECEPEFASILTYLQDLPQNQASKPNYQYIRKCFKAI